MIYVVMLGLSAIGMDFLFFYAYKSTLLGCLGEAWYKVVSIGSIVLLFSFFAQKCRKYFDDPKGKNI